jgi:predicted nucleic acid-binding protein
MILELAVSAEVSAIVTHNVKDFKGSDKFGIVVLTPKEFLQRLGKTS